MIQVLNITIAADSTDNIHESSEFYDFEAADLNGDNRIDFAEFVAQLKVYREGYQLVQEEEDTIRESFEFFDHDRSGKIDSQEMLYALRMLGEKSTKESVEQLFKEFDANGDGQISFEEVSLLNCRTAHTMRQTHSYSFSLENADLCFIE